MKTTAIAALFVVSVLLTWTGAVSENQAEASINWNKDNPERFDDELDLLDMLFGFALGEKARNPY